MWNSGISAKFYIKNLTIGKKDDSKRIYGYTFIAEGNGLWINGPDVVKLTYCNVNSQSGIQATYTQDIIPEQTGDKGKFFNLNLSGMGINEGDTVTGQVFLSTSVAAWEENRTAQKNSETIPFTEADIRLLKQVW